MGSIPIARSIRLAAAAALLAACAGTVPPRDVPPAQGMAAVLIGARASLDGRDARQAEAVVDLESAGPAARKYQLSVRAGESALYLVEPGAYHLAPPRSLLGAQRWWTRVSVEGQDYATLFPNALLRRTAIDARPGCVVSVGMLDIRALAKPGVEAQASLALDDGLPARRALVQAAVRDMMDSSRPTSVREGAIAWSQALEQSLVELSAEPSAAPADAKKP